MPKFMEVKVRGIQSVRIGLADVREGLPKKVPKMIFEGVQKFMLPLAKTYVPVRTGRLKRSIGVKKIAGGAQFFASAKYAWWVELGAGGGPRRLPIGSRYPRPFMGPAVAEGMPRLLNYISSAIRKRVIARARFKTFGSLRGARL